MAKREASEAGEASNGGSERSELPSGWCWATVGEVCDLINGRAFKPTEWRTTGLPIVRIQNLNNADALFNCFDGDVDSRHRVQSGDLLFAWSGTPGTSFGAHIWNRGDAVLNQHIFKVMAHACVDRWYLMQTLNFLIDKLIDLAHGGAGLAHVTKPKLEALQVPLPPLAEQRRIVAKLEAMLGRIRRARAALDAVPAMVERYKKSVLGAACAFSSSEELGVRRVALRDVIDGFESGRNLSAHARPARADEYGVLKVSAVSWGEFDATENKALFDGDLPKRSEFVRKGDVLISRANTSELVGAVVWVQSEYPNLMLPDKILRLRIQATEAEPRYVVYALRTPAVRRYFADVATGTSDSMRNISQAKLGETAFPLPPLDEQRAIVARIDAAFARARALLSAAETARAQLDTLERSLLAKAFRGELVPQDPSDEPASALLDRVRAERAESAAPKRAKKAKRASA